MPSSIPYFFPQGVLLLLLCASWVALVGFLAAQAIARQRLHVPLPPTTVESIYHTLHEATLLLATVEQRLAGLEQHAAHEREIRTLMLERLNARSRSPRKAAPPE